MGIKLANIQAQNGIPAAESFYRAWDGFRKRGVRCEFFEPHQLDSGALPLARDTLVAGGCRSWSPPSLSSASRSRSRTTCPRVWRSTAGARYGPRPEPYGLEAMEYSELLEARWAQLAGL